MEGTRIVVPLAVAETVLQPAYAITVHKSQGSEWDSVVVVLGERDTWVDQRLLFTAATRARKNLSLVGQVDAFRRAAKHTIQRVTLLKSFLDESLPDSAASSATSHSSKRQPVHLARSSFVVRKGGRTEAG
jgi:ATP-dependent exoDNAse (exonuclease V) alpha subunit